MRKLVLRNGKIYVERGRFAQALYAEDGVIQAVGTEEEVLTAAGKRDGSGNGLDGAEIIDLEGRTVIPGINDSHMHLLNVGMDFATAPITGVSSVDEMVERVKEFVRQNPETAKQGIAGKGWNQDLFIGEKRMPGRYDLDRISTEVPVVLQRICGHVAAANSKAIELLGLDQKMRHVDGGTIETDENGMPTGIFTENAMELVNGLIPKYTLEDDKRMFLNAAEYAVAHGITSVQSNDVGNAFISRDDTFRMLHEIYDEGLCPLRYRHQACIQSLEEFRECVENGEFKHGVYKDPKRLALGPLKLFKDGSLGGRTAAMRKEYQDDPGNRGVECITKEEMDEFCRLADAAGIQVVTHVIGDRAIEDVIESYEKVLHDGKNPLRHALIHCQITDREMMERIAGDDILICYQPIFLDYDMHVVTDRCGEELSSTSYAFGTAKELGIHVSYGTDSPVENCNPFPNLYSAVTRRDQKGWPEGGFFPEERVDIEDAVDAYTIGSAYNEFAEDFKGRLKPGYLADMAVLDTDIFTCRPEEIRTILPVMTIVDGQIVYRKTEELRTAAASKKSRRHILCSAQDVPPYLVYIKGTEKRNVKNAKKNEKRC